MPSASNENQIAKRRVQQAKDRETDKTVITALMATPDGRRWVWRQLEFGQLFLAMEDIDPYRLAFNQGKRVSALKLLKDVQGFTPDLYIRMTNENTQVELKEPSDDGSDDEQL